MPTLLNAVAGVHPDDLEAAVALGTVPNWRIWRKWNENPTVDTTQEEMSNIASGIRVLPTTATVISIASTSAEDGAGTSTGALTARVWYLDANWNEAVEDVTLNGTSTVTTVGTAIRLIDCDILTVGSAGATVGNITFTIDGNPQARILIGHNQTRESAIHVPAGHVFLPTNVVVSSGRVGGTVDTDIALEFRDGANQSPWITVVSFEIYQGSIILPFPFLRLTEKYDYRVLAQATGGTGPDCHVQTRGYMIRTDAY